LRFAPRARADIADIHQYITQHNTGAATSVVRQIRATSLLLARYPGLGRETDIPESAYFQPPVIPILSITACAAMN
jgi:plasmid stabilization system protein ParE